MIEMILDLNHRRSSAASMRSSKSKFCFIMFFLFLGWFFISLAPFALANSGVVVKIVLHHHFPMVGGAFTGEVRSGRPNMREGPTNDLDASFSDKIRSLKEDWVLLEFVGMDDVEAVEWERFSCDSVDLSHGKKYYSFFFIFFLDMCDTSVFMERISVVRINFWFSKTNFNIWNLHWFVKSLTHQLCDIMNDYSSPHIPKPPRVSS